MDAEARELLAFGMGTSQVHGFVDATACGIDAAVKLWSGSPDDPVSLPRLREIAGSYPARLSFMLSCYLARRLVRLGRVEEAVEEAGRAGLKLDTPEVTLHASIGGDVARCRDLVFALAIDVAIATGHLRQAEVLMVEEVRRATAEGRSARLVELALDDATIMVQTGKLQAGSRHLSRAVRLAARRRIVRPFHEHADAIATLVESTKASAWGFALAEERKFFAEICLNAPMGDRGLQDKLVALNSDSHLLEALTARQIEMLGLLDAGLSNQQMADQIDVSLTTIKWHLQQLYAKLGVSSRAAALARARALNLLAR